MRILMVTYSMPYRMTTGAEVCTQNYVDAISALGHQIDVVAFTRVGDPTDGRPPNFHSAGDWFVETAQAGARAYAWMARAFLSGQPYVTTKFKSRGMTRAIEALVARNHYDCTIIDHTQLGWLLDHGKLPGPLIFNAHNLEHKLYADQAAEQRSGSLKRWILARDARLLRVLETRLVGQCRQTWTLTAAEREGFSALVPGSFERVHVFDLPGRPMPVPQGERSVDIDVGILGGWLWDVNRRGLEWFIARVVPLLPDSIRIHIAGKGASAVPNPHANVVYEGFVDNGVEFLRRCRLVVVPTVAGAGVQLKTIEGICTGVPMVSTPIGLRGLRNIPDFVSVAETAEQMAALIRNRVASPLSPSFSAGADWSAARWSAFRDAVGAALAALR